MNPSLASEWPCPRGSSTWRSRNRPVRTKPSCRSWSDQDLQDGFQLTGLFLLRHVLEPRGQGHSDARDGFINAVSRHRASVAQV